MNKNNEIDRARENHQHGGIAMAICPSPYVRPEPMDAGQLKKKNENKKKLPQYIVGEYSCTGKLDNDEEVFFLTINIIKECSVRQRSIDRNEMHTTILFIY